RQLRTEMAMSGSHDPQHATGISAHPQDSRNTKEKPNVAAEGGNFCCGLPGTRRRFAKCKATRTLFREEGIVINGVIPSGKRFYFQCRLCGKQIKVRSLWRNLLTLAGCLIFAQICALVASSPNWPAALLASLLAFFPLVLLFETITRIRYPSVA